MWPLLLVVVAAVAVDFGHRPQPIGIDFHTYLAAARVGVNQGWSHIYDQAVVATQQATLAPNEHTQPFLSPPPVAWLAAGLVGLPYGWAYSIWAIATLSLLAGAVAWSAKGGWTARSAAAVFAAAPVWALQADYLGQVVLLVAAALVIAWRLARDNHEVAAGLVLAVILLKPNTAFVVPLAIAASGRHRMFATFSIAAAAVAGAALVAVGVGGLETYVNQLQHPPPGTDAVTLEAALGVSGVFALGLRIVLLAAVLWAAWRSRASPGQVIALGVFGSLLITPYLHVCDLCLLAAGGWMLWQEHPAPAWRAPLAASWLAASPFVDLSVWRPTQNRWPLLELVWLVALAAASLSLRPSLMRLDRPMEVLDSENGKTADIPSL
jgi:hypothetical protein